MEIALFKDIVMIFIPSVAILFVCLRLKIPTIVGFLLTGILLGPYGFGLIGAAHNVEILAEIGVVMLLFSIGIEFSLKSLYRLKKHLLLGGSTQVVATIAITYFLAGVFGIPKREALFLGLLFSLSSTAIVLKILQEKAEIDTPHGRSALGILIFQDVIIVPMMIFTPLIAGVEGRISTVLWVLLAKILGVAAIVYIFSEWLIPKIFEKIIKTRSRELFLLTVIALCLTVAMITSFLGLSIALGAFLAGLIISRSQYSHFALGNVIPFRDIFLSFFFVSTGMLLNLKVVFANPLLIIGLALATILIKSNIAGLSITLLGFPFRTAFIGGLALSQVGEFSIILSGVGIKNGLLSGNMPQIFLAVCILTMGITPFLMNWAPDLADRILKFPIPDRIKRGFYPVKDSPEVKTGNLKDHLTIIGFGINGKNVAKAAKITGVPYVITEMNPNTVREEQAKGLPIFYGDATQPSMLEHVGIRKARVLVVVISDHAATRQICAIAKELNPAVHIITRTKYTMEVGPLYKLGADEVIPEEFETSIEIFTRVLEKYLVPKGDIEKLVKEVRSDGYGIFRMPKQSAASLADLKVHCPSLEVASYRVTEDSSVLGKSLSEIGLRKKFGLNLVAIQKGKKAVPNPDADTKIEAQDIVIVLGDPGNISKASRLFQKKDYQ